jgi:hypothetical protein
MVGVVEVDDPHEELFYMDEPKICWEALLLLERMATAGMHDGAASQRADRA